MELHFCWFSSSFSFWSIFHNVNLIFADSYAYVTKLKLYLYKTVYVSFAKWAFLFISGFISFTTDIVRMERERERERERVRKRKREREKEREREREREKERDGEISH